MGKNDTVPPFTGNEDWTEAWQLHAENACSPAVPEYLQSACIQSGSLL